MDKDTRNGIFVVGGCFGCLLIIFGLIAVNDTGRAERTPHETFGVWIGVNPDNKKDVTTIEIRPDHKILFLGDRGEFHEAKWEVVGGKMVSINKDANKQVFIEGPVAGKLVMRPEWINSPPKVIDREFYRDYFGFNENDPRFDDPTIIEKWGARPDPGPNLVLARR